MSFPVFKALTASIAYVASHILTLIKILWLPTLLLMAVQAYLMPSMIDAQLQIGAVDDTDPSAVFEALGPAVRSTGLLYLAAAIFYPMMIAGVLRHVVRGEEPGLPFYLNYGADELRILAATILYVVMIIIMTIGGALALTVLGVALAAVSGSIGGIIGVALTFAFLGALVWFVVRMSLIFAAAVGERSIGIADSWRLTAQSFWGLFFYWLIWLLIFLVLSGLFFAVMAGGYFSFISEMIAAGGDPEAIKEIERRMLEMQRDLYDISTPGGMVFLGATYVFTIVYTALWTSAGGVAYRYLTGAERSA